MLCKEVLAVRLKTLRKAAGERQTELAEAIGLAQTQVSAMESGKQGTSLDKIIAICQHYDISADYLLGMIEEPRPLHKRGPGRPSRKSHRPQ